MLRVATAYFEVLSTEEVLDTLRQQQVADVQLLASARKQFELGNVSIADVYEAQASADRALAASIKANSDVELARQGLARIIGRQSGSLLGLRDGVSLEPPFPADINSWIREAEQNGFEVQAQALLLDIARNEVRSRKADHLPSVDLVASKVCSSARTWVLSAVTRPVSAFVSVCLCTVVDALAQQCARPKR